MSLSKNSIITIYISPGIQNTGGALEMKEGVESYFTTEMSPMYATVNDARKIAGPHIQDISDDVLNQVIYQYSVTAEYLAKCVIDSRWAVWAGYWVLYKTLLVTLKNTDEYLSSGQGKVFKQLGDFSVSRDAGVSGMAGINRLLNWLECETYKYEFAVKNCTDPLMDCLGMSNATARRSDYVPKLPGLVEKGACDPNKFNEGRTWKYDPNGDNSGDSRVIQFGKKYGVNKKKW